MLVSKLGSPGRGLGGGRRGESSAWPLWVCGASGYIVHEVRAKLDMEQSLVLGGVLLTLDNTCSNGMGPLTCAREVQRIFLFLMAFLIIFSSLYCKDTAYNTYNIQNTRESTLGYQEAFWSRVGY